MRGIIVISYGGDSGGGDGRGCDGDEFLCPREREQKKTSVVGLVGMPTRPAVGKAALQRILFMLWFIKAYVSIERNLVVCCTAVRVERGEVV